VFGNESLDIAQAVSKDGAMEEMGGGFARLAPTPNRGKADAEKLRGLFFCKQLFHELLLLTADLFP
jgi:hypothetical protein